MVEIRPNVITVKGVDGYVLSDTLPSLVQLSIKGGKDNIDLGGVISLSVVDGKIIDAVMKLRLGMMGVKMEMSILNTLTNSTLTGFNKGKILFQISSKTVGTNLINSMVDYKKYPPTQSMTSKRITLDNNLQIAYTQNRITLLNKIKEMRAAGLKPKSKAYAEGLVEAKKQAQNTMVYNVTDNIYLGSASPRAVEVKTGVWSLVQYITLQDGSSYSIIEFDKQGLIRNMSRKLQTLIERLGELTGIDSSTM